MSFETSFRVLGLEFEGIEDWKRRVEELGSDAMRGKMEKIETIEHLFQHHCRRQISTKKERIQEIRCGAL